jgi:hypothetical protein
MILPSRNCTPCAKNNRGSPPINSLAAYGPLPDAPA